MYLTTRFAIFTITILLIQTSLFAQELSRIKIQIISDEAEAVLKVLDKRNANKNILESDWQSIFNSEGYVRLKKREHALKRSFSNKDFKKFVLSSELLKRRSDLTKALSEWKQISAEKAGKLALAYLPKNSEIKSKIYPVIKPKTNSFVFEITTNPAIFLYLDPTVSKKKFENTLAHELHHIGYANNCDKKDVYKTFPQNIQKVLKWTGAFGEGFAMLAAAGGTKNHPHSVSDLEEKKRWDKDVANFNVNLKLIEKFFLNLSNEKLTDEKEIETARSFYGIQGPWYTVGWKMGVVIEETFGRSKLIECMCDKTMLFKTYNEAVPKYNQANNEKLAFWSTNLISKKN